MEVMLMISPAMSPPNTAPGNEPTPPITTTTKVCTRIASPTSGVSDTTGALTMPANPAAVEEADGLDDDHREAERDEELVLVRAAVEVADHHPLHHQPEHHEGERPGDHGDGERVRRLPSRVAGVAAQHEHGAVGEVED